MTWSCPCGCALQLDVGQRAREMRMIAIVGTAAPQHIELRSEGQRPERMEPPEPTTPGICRSCGARIDLATYMVAFLALKNAAWPMCSRCHGAQ